VRFGDDPLRTLKSVSKAQVGERIALLAISEIPLADCHARHTMARNAESRIEVFFVGHATAQT
jgi:hypothetical protein